MWRGDCSYVIASRDLRLSDTWRAQSAARNANFKLKFAEVASACSHCRTKNRDGAGQRHA